MYEEIAIWAAAVARFQVEKDRFFETKGASLRDHAAARAEMIRTGRKMLSNPTLKDRVAEDIRRVGLSRYFKQEE